MPRKSNCAFRKFTDEEEQEIIRVYLNGASLGECGSRFGCTGSGVRMILKRHNVPRRLPWTATPAAIIESIHDLYASGCTNIGEIAKRASCSDESVVKALEQSGTRTRSTRGGQLAFSRKVEAEIVTAYKAGSRTRDLAVTHCVHRATILRVLQQQGVVLRGSKPFEDLLSVELLDRLKMLASQGVSQRRIAQEFGVSQSRISRLLIKLGMRRLERESSETASHLRQGYRMVRIQPDDSMISMANVCGYVAEHRLVIARHIGRPLTKNESVHHIDGDKLHNDVANLQLRHGRHGTGACFNCRACGSSDVVPVQIADPEKAEQA